MNKVSSSGHVEHIFQGKYQKLTPYQGKKRSFGHFRCEDCDNEWESAYSWANKGQQCRTCYMSFVYPYKQVTFSSLSYPARSIEF